MGARRKRQFVKGDERGFLELPPIGADQSRRIVLVGFRRAPEGPQPLFVKLDDGGLDQRHAVFEMVQHRAAGKTDRKRVEEGKSVSVRVDLGGRRIIKKKKKTKKDNSQQCPTQKKMQASALRRKRRPSNKIHDISYSL